MKFLKFLLPLAVAIILASCSENVTSTEESANGVEVQKAGKSLDTTGFVVAINDFDRLKPAYNPCSEMVDFDYYIQKTLFENTSSSQTAGNLSKVQFAQNLSIAATNMGNDADVLSQVTTYMQTLLNKNLVTNPDLFTTQELAVAYLERLEEAMNINVYSMAGYSQSVENHFEGYTKDYYVSGVSRPPSTKANNLLDAIDQIPSWKATSIQAYRDAITRINIRIHQARGHQIAIEDPHVSDKGGLSSIKPLISKQEADVLFWITHNMWVNSKFISKTANKTLAQGVYYAHNVSDCSYSWKIFSMVEFWSKGNGENVNVDNSNWHFWRNIFKVVDTDFYGYDDEFEMQGHTLFQLFLQGYIYECPRNNFESYPNK